MLRGFSITIAAATMAEAQKELDERTSEFLSTAGGDEWECMEDSVFPDTAWVPGLGFYGSVRGYRGYRRFVNRAGESEEENAKEGVQQGVEKSSTRYAQEVREEKGYKRLLRQGEQIR